LEEELLDMVVFKVAQRGCARFLLVIVERINGRTDDDRREGIKPSTESKVVFGEKKTGTFERIETFTKTRDVDLDSSFERGHRVLVVKVA
jgi:hypothetical protein